ncbi:unnamed protein product [Dovyalis caffra]|uniref:Germin-like protein n=1 Tax=Dovyalis caffra TaxID=77055 RepID=A0AAV1RXQ1_9ROSI|nr:unnamed protein product [Dovyalis caffra]
MEVLKFVVVFVILALASSLASASDPFPLQDFCVAINETNGGLNTLGLALGRADYAPNGGLFPLHTHSRGTETLLVLEGTLYVGFVISNPDNRLISKVLNPGDVFVFPIGLVHFQINVGKTNAVAYGFFSSQNPGLIIVANSVFGSKPLINTDVLTKGFQLDKKVVDYLQKQFGLPRHEAV